MVTTDDNSNTANGTDSLPFATLLHMMTIKVSSSNYLLWKNQIHLILQSQNLLKFLDGSAPPPSAAIDQQLRMLLNSSLSEEAMAVTIGTTTATEAWKALEATFSHSSETRELSLRADLQNLTKGTNPVQEYARNFKHICDQLASIGKPVNESFKSQWFLRGLGTDFTNFSTAQMALTPIPPFTDLIHRAEAHEIFCKSLLPSPPTQAAFTASTSRGQGSYRGSSSRPGNNFANRRGRGGCRSTYIPRCQLCGRNGHKANQCHAYVLQRRTGEGIANLAETFTASSNPDVSDWYMDSGASAHMTPTAGNLHNATPYQETEGRNTNRNRET